MYQTLLNVLTTFNPSWSTNTAISAVVTTLTSLLGLLGIAGTTQKNATKGITQSKAQARSNLIQMALAHSAAGMAYAASISNTTLRVNSKLTESKLNKASDASFVSLCMALYNLLNPYAASLTAFGANAATLLAFKNAITSYQPVSQTPKNARAAKKSATLNVGAQLTAIDTLVKNQLDPLMVQFKTTNTDFYDQYTSLRHAAPVSHHLKYITLQLHIKTAAGLALQNAEIKLTSIKHKKRKALSKADGSRNFTRLKPDTFTIVVSLPGYVTQTQTITVNAPQKLPVNFVLVASTGGTTGGGTTTGTTPPVTA